MGPQPISVKRICELTSCPQEFCSIAGITIVDLKTKFCLSSKNNSRILRPSIQQNNFLYISLTFILLGSMRNRVGSRWLHIGGKLMQIDSGPFGIVRGVNKANQIWCRTGIAWKNPKGRGWRRVPGGLKYVSVGEFGAWGVNKHDYIYFRYGVSRRRPQGIYGLSVSEIRTKRNSIHTL